MTLFPWLVSARPAQSGPLLPAEIFPSPQQRAHRPSLFKVFVISRKAEHRIAANHCCWVWPLRANFLYRLFFFPASWALVVFTFRSCHFTVSWKSIWVRHLASKNNFGGVQIKSKRLTVSPLISEMERLKKIHLLLFSAFNPITSHLECPEGQSWHL